MLATRDAGTATTPLRPLAPQPPATATTPAQPAGRTDPPRGRASETARGWVEGNHVGIKPARPPRRLPPRWRRRAARLGSGRGAPEAQHSAIAQHGVPVTALRAVRYPSRLLGLAACLPPRAQHAHAHVAAARRAFGRLGNLRKHLWHRPLRDASAALRNAYYATCTGLTPVPARPTRPRRLGGRVGREWALRGACVKRLGCWSLRCAWSAAGTLVRFWPPAGIGTHAILSCQVVRLGLLALARLKSLDMRSRT